MKKLNIKNILHLVTCLIFLGFIGIFTLTNLFAEKKSFSENENRVLTEFPSASFSNIFFGNFDTEFESWFSDHFIGRDGWIRTKASFLKTIDAIENNTVYFARDHRLIQQFIDYDEKLVESNISYINEFAQENGLKLNIMLVPGASQGEKKYLPLIPGHGINGLSIALGINACFIKNRMPYTAIWGVPYSKLWTAIEHMLDEDIPVIFSIGPNFPLFWQHHKLRFYYQRTDGAFVPGPQTHAHYVTITGMDEQWLQIASWGKKYYIKKSEYIDYVRHHSIRLVSNILYIRKKSRGVS